MSETNNRSGLFVGLNKGHVVKTVPARKRPVLRKGRLANRSKAIREVMRDVCGFSPLDKKMLEMIRTGIASKEKKAVKIARQKIGTHLRAQQRRDNLLSFIQTQRRK